MGALWLFCFPARLHAQDPPQVVRTRPERDWTDFEYWKNYTYIEDAEFPGPGRGAGLQQDRWVDAEALDTRSVGLRLARIAPGGNLHFEQVRAKSGCRRSFKSALKNPHVEIDITYHDYKNFQTDSKIVDIWGN